MDEVLHLSDGTLSPLDYKEAEYNDFIYRTHKIQSSIYALLIMDSYGKPVKRGFICYTRGGNKLKEIIYKESDFYLARQQIEEIFSIITTGYFPKKTPWTNRCIDCCYKNICI